MNKISDLNVGDQVVTIKYGKGIIADKGFYYVKITGLQIKPYGCPFFYDNEIDWQKTNELNNKQMKEFIIECPSGFEVDKEKSTFEKIVFKEIENKLHMSVEEIPNRNWYIAAKSEIKQLNTAYDKNNLSTKERAEAFLALMQLVELRDAWNGDWKADWNNSEKKYLIFVSRGDITKFANSVSNTVLHFKSEQLRDQFAEQFKDLIEQAKELL